MIGCPVFYLCGNHFGVRFRYLTTTVGVDPAYKSEPFYKPTLDDDERRVNDLFARAEENSIAIERRSLSAVELNALLTPPAPPASAPAGAPVGASPAVRPAHVVVALVDRRFLYRPVGVVETCLNYCFTGTGYVGHYVVLLGYDAQRDTFRLLDPARPAAEPLVVAASDVHAARRCHGTDEDLLVVPWEQSDVMRSGRRRPAVDPAASASAAA